MTEIKSSGLYVHVPFCKRKCNYCDFCSSAASDTQKEKYTKAIISEIESYKTDEGKIKLDTVYFGGGTPSVLDVRLLEEILACVRNSFEILPDAEITVEVNPGTADFGKLVRYFDLGFNRLSIGLQSIHENELIKLGRIHNLADFNSCFASARKAGFDNISVDLMYGIPYQTKESFDSTLSYVISLGPEHISVYGLMIEEGTPFFEERDSLVLPTEDDECDMYFSANERLEAAGYSHYEISNFAKAGKESRHNMRYWRMRDYIGVGVSAHSYHLGRRYFNTDKIEEYLSEQSAKYKRKANAPLPPDREEFIMLALRLKEGIDLSRYEELFSEDFVSERLDKIRHYESLSLLKRDSDRVYLTPKGFYVSNTIISDLL